MRQEKKVVEQFLAEYDSTRDLNENAQFMIEEGWQLYSPPFTNGNLWFQLWVRYEESN